ncbi:MAG: DEAD/DEAH box helicase [Aureispira sp.]|nr:DEAD/DEAH box helicase [Aureispira sp.]
MSFSSLGVVSTLLPLLKEQNYTTPYPIQEKAIPAIIKGNDLLGIAQTGSGKTASYVLPILSRINVHKIVKNRHVLALVLVPTRELAIQVGEVFDLFRVGLADRVKSLAVHGGVSINPQMKALQGTHILVATPGRLIDLVESNAVYLSDVETLVLDEADKMLNLGFQEEMNKILALLPPRRQNLLFSATLSSDVDNMNRVLLKNPVVVEVEAKEQPTEAEAIRQTAYLVEDAQKGPFLRYLIKSRDLEQILVFVSSIRKADNMVGKLRKNGIRAAAIHSKKSQGARTSALATFKSGKTKVLIATDLLSRGIDIEQLPYVINYELPRSPKDYVHRIGRTGRADASGEAITILTKDDLKHFKVIQKKMGKWIQLTYTDDIDLKGY